MTREIGPELVARIRHVADSLEAIARGEVDSPQPFIAAYAAYLNGEYDSSYGPDAIDEALEIAAECNGEVVPLYRTPQTPTTPRKCSVQGKGTSPKSHEKNDAQRVVSDTKRGPSAWLAVAADGSESSAVYLLKEQADAAAREWGWFVVPLYPFPALWPEDEIAIEAAWQRTGLKPTWPDDEPQTGVRCANAMADEIERLRNGAVESCETVQDGGVVPTVTWFDQKIAEECRIAQAEIARLREAIRRLADQDATLSVCDGDVTVTMDATLTAEEREAIEWAVQWVEQLHRERAATLRSLLERTK